MPPSSFVATAWNNGRWHRTGAGYGLKIPIADRDRHFDQDWDTVTLRLIGPRTNRTAEAKGVDLELILGILYKRSISFNL